MKKAARRWLVIISVVLVTWLAIHSLTTTPALSQEKLNKTVSPELIATAALPPKLVQERSSAGGRLDVLYMTRSQDIVVVRCYPGYKPRLIRNKAKQNLLSCDVQE